MDSPAVVTAPHIAGPLHLHPFRALGLAPRRIGDPASARAFARPYRDVLARLDNWVARGHAHRDDDPAVYLHEYSSEGIVVRGLVGALDVSRLASTPGDRVVFPHEGVHPTQADELADRMGQMQVNPAPILLVHHGSPRARELVARTAARKPHRAFTDRSGQKHRIWAIRDPQELALLDDALAGSQALIADGHHRYAAYLQLQHRSPGTAADRGLAMLVDQDDSPLFLGAIHRFFSGPNLAHVRIAAEKIEATYRTLDHDQAVAALDARTLVVTDGEHWASIGLDIPAGRTLIEILHEELLPALPRQPTRTGYHHSVDGALARAARTAGVVAPAARPGLRPGAANRRDRPAAP